MDAEMVAMFPKGIRALIIDDDNKFLKSTTMLLSVLNFDVVVCSSVTHALKSLTSGDLQGFDVILTHAAKAAACGFDFRAIVEADLLIPVIYFLPQEHQATGEEADELLSTLQTGTYIMKKPLDINEVRTRLWSVIAWHKCGLETKASGGGAGGKRTAGEAGLDAEGEDEDRVHYKVVRARCGRKRKGSSKPGSSSAVTGGHPMAKGKEKENEASQFQPAQQKRSRGKKPTLFVQSIPRTPNVPPTYNPKFFTSSTVPSYNPKFLFFSDAAGPSSNAGASSSVTPSATPPMYSSTPSALPLVARQQQQPSAHHAVFGNIVSPALVTTTMPATNAAYEPPQFPPNIGNQQQQDIPSLLTFGPFPYQGPPLPPVVQQDMVTPPVASAAAATEAGAYNNEVSLSFLEASILGAEQDGGGDRASIVGMGMYTRMADPPVAAQNIGDVSNKAAMLEALFSDDYGDCSSGSSFTELDQVLGMASNVNGPTTMNTFGSINAAPFVAPQVLSIEPNDGSSSNTASLMPSNVSDLTLTGGAFDRSSFASSMVPQDLGAVSNGGSNNAALSIAHQGFGAAPIGGGNNAAPFMAPRQDLGIAPNGGSSNATPFVVPHQDVDAALNDDQLALDNEINYGLLGSQGDGPVEAMEGSDASITASIMLPSDQYEDNTSFPLEALLGDLQGPIFEFDDVDLDALVNGSISGGATATDAAGTSFMGGGGGMDDSAISSLDGLEIPEGLFTEYGSNFCG